MGKAPKVNAPEEHPKAKYHLGTFTAPPPLCLVRLSLPGRVCVHLRSAARVVPTLVFVRRGCAHVCLSPDVWSPGRHVQNKRRARRAYHRQAIFWRPYRPPVLEDFPRVSPLLTVSSPRSEQWVRGGPTNWGSLVKCPQASDLPACRTRAASTDSHCVCVNYAEHWHRHRCCGQNQRIST